MENRPRGRQKNVSGTSGSVHRRGSGIGSSGPVGRADGYSGRRKGNSYNGGSSRPNEFYGTSENNGQSAGTTRGLGGGKLIIILIAALVLFGGGSGLGSLLGLFGGGSSSSGGGFDISSLLSGGSSSSASQQSSGLDIGSAFSSLFGGGSTASSTWTKAANTGKLDKSVASGSRSKYTDLLGGGKDTVTLMVYMCGTDLESKSGMASADLQEMLDATVSDKINLLVFTGGCSSWKNNTVSSSVNQIYKITDKNIEYVVKDNGKESMTLPSTLRDYITFCLDNYPANRYGLILWDHGGGSLSGFGYDEKHKDTGSMTLKGINDALKGALKNRNEKFDFIGFDACLMGTLENGLMLSSYADYLIASEETEPGIGWYYTKWLTDLSKNTSMPTIELGKSIIDSFVDECERKCAGQKATLSLVDLAELSNTAPEALSEFAEDTSEMLQKNGYQTVSDARSSTREFASSNKIDQIDLVDFAYQLNTKDSLALADSLLGAVKYNRTASCISNAYGISIYFPYRKTSGVNSAVSTYEAIGLDEEYTDCIRMFAGIQSGGQQASGSSGSPLGSLLGGGSSSSGLLGSSDIASLLSGMMGGGSIFGRELDPEATADYIAAHQFDASQLVWKKVGGVPQIALSEAQWSLVHELAVNVFFDDGEGYIDLGIDNSYSFSDDGQLLGAYDGTWLAIDGNIIAYYYMDTVENGDDYTITGRVPIMLNGDTRAEMILVFDNANPYGYVAGVRYIYTDGETDTVAKGITELEDGDTIDFLCDFYTYDGDYTDTFCLGEQYTWHGQPEITNVVLNADNGLQVTYLFTDIYNNEFWTPPVP